MRNSDPDMVKALTLTKKVETFEHCYKRMQKCKDYLIDYVGKLGNLGDKKVLVIGHCYTTQALLAEGVNSKGRYDAPGVQNC